jgi:hypothetical protein
VIPGLTIKKFGQHGDKYYMESPSKQVHVKLPCIMRKFHEWCYLACVYGLNFIEAKILGYIFTTLDFDLHVEITELHTIYCLKMLDITTMIVWCM